MWITKKQPHIAVVFYLKFVTGNLKFNLLGVSPALAAHSLHL